MRLKKKAENQPSKGNSQKSTKNIVTMRNKNEKMLVMYFDEEMMSQKHQ